MSIEDELRLPAETFSLPAELAEDYLKGIYRQSSALSARLEGGGARIPCYEHVEHVPGLGDVTFRVDYLLDGSEQKMLFSYFAPARDGEVECAAMVLKQTDTDVFLLDHRIVLPEFGRDQGIGSRLLAHAEDWVRQIAERRKRPTFIIAGVSQYDVLKWLSKNDYVPSEEYEELYQDVMANIGKTDKYEVEQAPTDHGLYLFIYEKTPEGGRKAAPIRILMEKAFMPATETSRA